VSLALATQDDAGPAAEVFVIRAYREGDSWLKQAWKREDMKLEGQGLGRRRRDRARPSFMEAVRPEVTRIIDNPDVTILVACQREDADYLAGWVAVFGGREITSYIKAMYRPWSVAVLLKHAMDALKETP
jgi:hypothetical protein